jgi:hypothetical protein
MTAGGVGGGQNGAETIGSILEIRGWSVTSQRRKIAVTKTATITATTFITNSFMAFSFFKLPAIQQGTSFRTKNCTTKDEICQGAD